VALSIARLFQSLGIEQDAREVVLLSQIANADADGLDVEDLISELHAAVASRPSVRQVAYRLRQNVVEAPLRKAFENWLQGVILPRFGVSQEEAATLKLEELETMLAEKIDRWNREILEKGREEPREEGRDEGRQEGEARLVLRLIRLKFGPLEPELEERVRTADPDSLLVWGERVLTAENLQDVFRD
jgi:hypothetical protein